MMLLPRFCAQYTQLSQQRILVGVYHLKVPIFARHRIDSKVTSTFLPIWNELHMVFDILRGLILNSLWIKPIVISRYEMITGSNASHRVLISALLTTNCKKNTTNAWKANGERLHRVGLQQSRRGSLANEGAQRKRLGLGLKQ